MIDSQLHEQLRQKYNPDGSDLRNYQLVLLGILKDFDAICKAHDIKYWLSSGTCLGAIRHGGFIPWDDDIDIDMLYEDYLKFQKIFEEDDRLVLQTYDNDLFYTQPFPKLRLKGMTIKEGTRPKNYKYNGPFIDLFVIEPVPYVLGRFCHLSVGAMRLYSFRIKNHGYQTRVLKIWKKANKLLLSSCRLLTKICPTKNIRYTFGTGFENEVRRMDELFPLGEATFEGERFPVPGNSHKYLERFFGDYMKIPEHIHTHYMSFKDTQFK